MISPTYLAGVWDSDGSFSIMRYKQANNRPKTWSRKWYYRAQAQLTWTQTDKSLNVMQQIKSRYGGYILAKSDHKEKYGSNTKPTYQYIATGNAARKLIADILPYLELKFYRAILCQDQLDAATVENCHGPTSTRTEQDRIDSELRRLELAMENERVR